MAHNKTWNLGEVCKGGVISASIAGQVIIVVGKEWDESKGHNKSSDQSNAKEFTRLSVTTFDANAKNKLDDFLCDLTTSYYASQVIDWIESKVKFTDHSW